MAKYSKNRMHIDYKQMNQLLAYVRDNYFPVFRKKLDNEPFNYYAFIEDLRTNFMVTLRIGNKKITYCTKKDVEELVQVVDGIDAYKTLRHYYDVPIIENADQIGSAVPLLFYNKKYNKTRQKAYAYDLNSAYSDAMRGTMPDTSKVVGKFRKVAKGEIGFIEYDSSSEDIPLPKNDLIMVGEGDFADIIFNEMESPFKKFVDVWYNRKKNAKNKKEKLKAKGILNYSVGYLQLKNPYLRSTIVTRCNNRIRALIDENTLYCNTDSLVSRVPRKELKIGSGLGEWKLEHQGQFAYINFNYQWDFDVPTYRSIPKAWFPKGYDILNDPIPKSHNIFYFDKETLQLRRIDYESEQSRETALQQELQKDRMD